MAPPAWLLKPLVVRMLARLALYCIVLLGPKVITLRDRISVWRHNLGRLRRTALQRARSRRQRRSSG